MARTKMNLSGEIRISDYLSLGMLANIIPLDVVKSTLDECGKQTIRQRKLPREFVMYFAVCMPLYSKVAIRSNFFRCEGEI
jgi:hypothetical protein